MKARSVGRALWDDGRGWILLFVALGWTMALGTRFIFPVLFPYFRESFHLDLSTLGILYTLTWGMFAIGQFPGGALADRFGERSILAFSTLLSCISVAIIGIAFNTIVLAFGMLLFGLATAPIGTVRITVLTNVYSNYDGTAIGLMQSMAQLGNTFLPIIAASIATYFTWRWGILFVIPFFLVAVIGLWVTVPRQTTASDSAVNDLSINTIRYFFSRLNSPRTLHLTGLLAVIFFIIQGLTAFYPTYLIDVKGIQPQIATLLFGLLFACAIIVEPIAGILGDTFDIRRTLIAFLCLQAVALLSLPFTTGVVQLAAITAILSTLFGVFPIAITYLTATIPEDMKGSGLGILRSIYFLIGATGSIMVGILAERGLFDESFFIFALLAFGAILLVLPLAEKID